MAIKSPLNGVHRTLGAKLTEFGGWDMPLQYKGVIAEHKAVRGGAGLFDVSHLGKLIVDEGQVPALDALLPGKVAKIPVGRAGYNLVLDETGGVIDDVFLYRQPSSMLIVPNASNTLEVLDFLHANAVKAEDARMRWAIIALSGPLAPGLGAELIPATADLKLHRFAEFDLGGHHLMVARTGYTGEPTLEFFCEWEEAPAVWDLLLKDPVHPCGLASRDTLRLEMGYPLHGHEISKEITPLEAGMEWLIDWDGPFVGKQALLDLKEAGITRKLVGLVAHGREIPRQGYKVSSGGQQVGELVSGNFSPVLDKGIAMGFVPPNLSQPGTRLVVDVRGRSLEMEVTVPPFIKDSR